MRPQLDIRAGPEIRQVREQRPYVDRPDVGASREDAATTATVSSGCGEQVT